MPSITCPYVPPSPSTPTIPVGFLTKYTEFYSAAVPPTILIGNTSITGDYNTGVYNTLTGVATASLTGYYFITVNVEVNNGIDPFISSYTTFFRINGAATQYSCLNDRVTSGEDSTSSSTFNVLLNANDTLSLDYSHNFVGTPVIGGTISVTWGMHLMSQ